MYINGRVYQFSYMLSTVRYSVVQVLNLPIYRFEKMGADTKKDLNAVKNAYKHGDPVPRYHHETRTFSLVQ